MKPRTLLLLVVVALVLVGISQMSKRPVTRGAAEDTYRLGDQPFADLGLGTVTEIQMTGAGETATLHQVDGTWRVEEQYNYPADFDKLAELVRSLPDLKVGQQMSSDPGFLAEYGLDPAGTTPPNTLRLIADNETLSEVQVGTIRSGGGQYIRIDNEEIVLLDEALSAVSAEPASWLDRELLSIPENELERVIVTPDEGPSYTLEVEGAGTYDLSTLAENESLKSFEPGRVARSLNNLMLVTALDPDQVDIDFGWDEGEQMSALLEDGRQYLFYLGGRSEDPNNRYLKIEVSYNQPPAPDMDTIAMELNRQAVETAGTNTVDDEALVQQIEEEYSRRLEAYEAEVATAQERVDDHRSAFSPWVFTVMNYTADSMTLPRDELVDVEDSEEEATVEEIESEVPAEITSDVSP